MAKQAKRTRANVWQRVAAVASATAALTVVVGSMVAASGWVGGYFAKEKQTSNTLCYMRGQLDLATNQLEAANLYGRYLNTKLEIEKQARPVAPETPGSKPVAPAATRDKVVELTVKKNYIWEELARVRKEGDLLAEQIKEKGCIPHRSVGG